MQGNFRKTSDSVSLTMLKPLTVWITAKCGKFLNRWEYQTTLPASWETCVQDKNNSTGHETMDWFQIGKGVHQGFILPSCLFNLYAEYIMWPVGLYESQVGTKIAGRNINNLRYSNDTTLMVESGEKLKSLLSMKEESGKAGLKFTIEKTKIVAPSPITAWQIDEEKVETMKDFIFLCSRITADGDCSQEIKRHLLLGRKAMTNLVCAHA